MASPTMIDDPTDPRLEEYTALNDAVLRQQIEGDTLCIAEGALVVSRVLRSRYPLRSALIAESRWSSLGPLGAALAAHPAPVYVAPLGVMSRVAGFAIHRGVVAAVTRLAPPPLDALLRKASCLAVLEGINDHENLGSIIRSAAALGVDGLLLDPTCCDPLYRRAIRVSMGEVFGLPFSRLEPWPDALAQVRLAGFTVVALTPHGEAEPITSIERPARPAVLLGSEGPGLTENARDAADRRVRIPMTPNLDSLGVAAAAAIAFHHFGRGTERVT
jgi:tRNA G18 (ribose-2'-O)-methylase SpoU